MIVKITLILFVLVVITACAPIQRIDDRVDAGKDAALTAFETAVEKANQIYDKLVIEHAEDGRRLDRFRKALGRD